jgi:hypothetical protein
LSRFTTNFSVMPSVSRTEALELIPKYGIYPYMIPSQRPGLFGSVCQIHLPGAVSSRFTSHAVLHSSPEKSGQEGSFLPQPTPYTRVPMLHTTELRL